MEGPHVGIRGSADAHLPQAMPKQDPKSQNSSPSLSQSQYSKRFDNSPQPAFQYKDMQAGPEPQVGDWPFRGNNAAVRRKPVSNSSKEQRRSISSTGSSQEDGPYHDCWSEEKAVHDNNIALTPESAENQLDDLSHQLSRTSVSGELNHNTMLGKTGPNQARHPLGPRPIPSHKAKAYAGEGRQTGNSEPSRKTVSQRRQSSPTDSNSIPTADEVLERAGAHTTDTTYHETRFPRKPFAVCTKARHCTVD